MLPGRPVFHEYTGPHVGPLRGLNGGVSAILRIRECETFDSLRSGKNVTPESLDSLLSDCVILWRGKECNEGVSLRCRRILDKNSRRCRQCLNDTSKDLFRKQDSVKWEPYSLPHVRMAEILTEGIPYHKNPLTAISGLVATTRSALWHLAVLIKLVKPNLEAPGLWSVLTSYLSGGVSEATELLRGPIEELFGTEVEIVTECLHRGLNARRFQGCDTEPRWFVLDGDEQTSMFGEVKESLTRLYYAFVAHPAEAWAELGVTGSGAVPQQKSGYIFLISELTDLEGCLKKLLGGNELGAKVDVKPWPDIRLDMRLPQKAAAKRQGGGPPAKRVRLGEDGVSQMIAKFDLSPKRDIKRPSTISLLEEDEPRERPAKDQPRMKEVLDGERVPPVWRLWAVRGELSQAVWRVVESTSGEVLSMNQNQRIIALRGLSEIKLRLMDALLRTDVPKIISAFATTEKDEQSTPRRIRLPFVSVETEFVIRGICRLLKDEVDIDLGLEEATEVTCLALKPPVRFIVDVGVPLGGGFGLLSIFKLGRLVIFGALDIN